MAPQPSMLACYRKRTRKKGTDRTESGGEQITYGNQAFDMQTPSTRQPTVSLCSHYCVHPPTNLDSGLFPEALNAQSWGLNHSIARDAFVTSAGEEAVALGDYLGPFGKRPARVFASS